MAIFRISKARDYKTIEICGLNIKIRRKDFAATFKPFRNLKSDTLLREDGVSLMTYSDSIAGDSVAVRYFINALKKAGIQYERLSLKGDVLPKYKNKITFSNAPYFKPKKYNNISVFYWEFEDGMPQFFPQAFDDVQAIIVFSAFNAAYFRSIAPENVKIYQLPFIPCIDFSLLSSPTVIRKKYSIPQESIVFYFNFSYNSSYARKNPEGLVRAFSMAFHGSEENAFLVLKTVGSNDERNIKYKYALENCIKKSGIEDRTIIIDNRLTDSENHSLINACDVYVSLHRGEGIGLGMLEAMFLGKPVIGTDYGGNTDFVKAGSAFPVPYKLINPEFNDIPDYAAVTKAADPDIYKAAEYMRSLYDNVALRVDIGKRAMDYAKSYCSLDKYREILEKILKCY